MTKNLLLVTGIMSALGLAGALNVPNLSEAQTPATPMMPAVTPPAPACNMMSDLIPLPPNAPQGTPRELTLVDQTTKDKILSSGLPCQEIVDITGPDANKTPLENLQRGFDFYSWLTFIALNSPADGRGIEKSAPNTKTKWEDMSNFKQLLDVMLPDGRAPKWEEKVIPPGCRSQYKPGMMVIEMIEETFNQPFKTGPLIDQRGNFALFDILMNKQTFDYIEQHGLYSKPVQMSEDRSKLKIDFPAGESRKIMGQVFKDIPESETKDDPGSIILKVSWKILDPKDNKGKFHTVDALVSMQPHDPQSEPPCLRKTLGLVGFHVMHKTKSRPQ